MLCGVFVLQSAEEYGILRLSFLLREEGMIDMERIKLTVTESNCRCGTCKTGDTFVVDTLCPPICHELWSCIYPMVYALQNGAELDLGDGRGRCFDAACPDGGRVKIHGEVLRTERKPARPRPSGAGMYIVFPQEDGET